MTPNSFRVIEKSLPPMWYSTECPNGCCTICVIDCKSAPLSLAIIDKAVELVREHGNVEIYGVGGVENLRCRYTDVSGLERLRSDLLAK